MMKPAMNLLERLEGRFRRSRPGSVLIFVVALLVLVALIATAFISTSRIDRYDAAQHKANTQIDLLLDGLVNMVRGSVVGDIQSPAGTRLPPDALPAGTNYEHADNAAVDNYLAARIPDVTLGWSSVSWPLVQNGPATATPYQFDRPDNGASVVFPTANKGDFYFVPTSGTFLKQTWPFLTIAQRTGGALAGSPIPAADADGDGIADAGLWKLLDSPIDGITYYAAARIIDNNSAINASVAWEPNTAAGTATAPPGDFFPTNIDLVGLLNDSATELPALNSYRTGDPGGAASLDPISDSAPAARAAVARTDFDFISGYDAMWSQLGRRLGYPGFNTSATSYVALQISDSVANAYHFCLRNSSASQSTLEQKLVDSLVNNAVTTVYQPNQVGTWYNQNFNFLAPGTTNTLPIRSITVARNPVANAAPTHSKYQGAWAAGADYRFGDWVTGSDGRSYVCIQGNTSSAGDDPVAAGASELFWQNVPWTSQPIKASANAAPFGELWHAFWDVMVEGTSDAPTLPGAGLVGSADTSMTMFRASTRYDHLSATPPTGAPDLTSDQQMILRAALAAVNTIDLRDSDNDVTSRKIVLGAGDGTAYDVMVYGAEAQPYITEALVHGDAATGYIAIELYNPYDFPITMTNWHIATLPRANPPVYPLVMTDQGEIGLPLGTANTALPGIQQIPAKGYVILEAGTAPPDVETQTAMNISLAPTSPPGNVIRVPFPTLLNAIGNEVVILRTRRADGQLSLSTEVTNPFAEGTPAAANIHEMVPVDQMDLTMTGATATDRYVYRRGNAETTPATVPNYAWHFVYPGIYDFAQPARYQGLMLDNADVGNLGAADGPVGATGAGDSTFITTPLQVANRDMGGPNKTIDPATNADAGQPYHFPFGAFARNGDLLQIPFVGAYRIEPQGGIVSGTPSIDMLEMNSLSMDSAFADDMDAANNSTANSTGAIADAACEQIGRFCPVGNPQTPTGDFAPLANPYLLADPANTARAGYRYQWAMDLFDYLTVQAPGDDYLPDVDPADSDVTTPASAFPAKYTGPEPAPVANVTRTIANDVLANVPTGATEDTAPVEGLININTASWRVLATLPLAATGTDKEMIAKAIVAYRDGTTTATGQPFNTIYDLYRVKEFADAQDTIIAAGDPDDADGDISPFNGTSPTSPMDGVRGDFEERFLLLNRISNLITTRSDSYTCYVLLQGYRGAGTANPELVAQRRIAFIVDRSGITTTNSIPQTTMVPNN